VGVPDALGEQAHWCSRSGGPLSGTDEPAERARFGDVAGLSVAHGEVAALIVPVREANLRRRAGIQTARTGMARPT